MLLLPRTVLQPTHPQVRLLVYPSVPRVVGHHVQLIASNRTALHRTSQLRMGTGRTGFSAQINAVDYSIAALFSTNYDETDDAQALSLDNPTHTVRSAQIFIRDPEEAYQSNIALASTDWLTQRQVSGLPSLAANINAQWQALNPTPSDLPVGQGRGQISLPDVMTVYYPVSDTNGQIVSTEGSSSNYAPPRIRSGIPLTELFQGRRRKYRPVARPSFRCT